MSFKRIGRVGFLLVTANSLSGIIWGGANSVILSIYMLSIGISTTLIGVILGLFSLINALGSLVVGYLTDFMDRIKLFTVLSTISGSLILLMITGMP